MPSLFDPNTYLNAIKKGKSILNQAREYTAKPETRTGTLERIKSEVSSYVREKAEKSQLPSTKPNFNFSRLAPGTQVDKFGNPIGRYGGAFQGSTLDQGTKTYSFGNRTKPVNRIVGDMNAPGLKTRSHEDIAEGSFQTSEKIGKFFDTVAESKYTPPATSRILRGVEGVVKAPVESFGQAAQASSEGRKFSTVFNVLMAGVSMYSPGFMKFNAVVNQPGIKEPVEKAFTEWDKAGTWVSQKSKLDKALNLLPIDESSKTEVRDIAHVAWTFAPLILAHQGYKSVKTKNVQFTPQELNVVKEKVFKGEKLNPKEQYIADYVKKVNKEKGIAIQEIEFPKEVISIKGKVERRIIEDITNKWNELFKQPVPKSVVKLIDSAHPKDLVKMSKRFDQMYNDLKGRGGIQEGGVVGLKGKQEPMDYFMESRRPKFKADEGGMEKIVGETPEPTKKPVEKPKFRPDGTKVIIEDGIELGKEYEYKTTMTDGKKNVEFSDTIKVESINDNWVNYKTKDGGTGGMNIEAFKRDVLNKQEPPKQEVAKEEKDIPVKPTGNVKNKYVEYLEKQIGDTFEVVDPVGDLWQSKDNALFIRFKKHRGGEIDKLRQSNFVKEAFEAGGDNVIQVVLNPIKAPAEKPKTMPTTETKVEVKSKGKTEIFSYVDQVNPPMGESTFFGKSLDDVAEYKEDTRKLLSGKVNESDLYQGGSSFGYVEEKGLMDKPSPIVEKLSEGNAKTPTELDEFLNERKTSLNPNLMYSATQQIAAENLKKEGYKGAHWTYEDDLTPEQYQIWDMSALETNVEPKVKKTMPTSDLATEAKKYKSADEFIGNIKKRFGEDVAIENIKDLDIYETKIDRKLVESFKKRIREGDESVFLHREAIGKAPAIILERRDGGRIVIDGNHRLLAAKELGVEQVPVQEKDAGSRDLELRAFYNKAKKQQVKEKIAKRIEDSPKTLPTPEPKKVEKKPTPKQVRTKKVEDILEKQAERAVKKEALESQVADFNKNDLELFDKMRRLKETEKYASGDLESLRKDYPQNVERMIQRYNEATGQDLVDTEAFEGIMSLPTRGELRELQRLLTREDIKFLREDRVLTEREVMKRRRIEIKAIKKHLGLSDQDLKKVSKRDIRFMTDEDFALFVNDLRVKAVEYAETKQKKNELIDLIRSREYKKWENYRQVMKFPPINNMTAKQLDQFIRALQPYKYGDVFLTEGQLDKVDRTSLKGIKTTREAREKLAEEMGIDVRELNNIKVGEFDKFRYDTALAEQNPFYKMMVDSTNKGVLVAEQLFLKTKQDFLRLAKKAFESRKKGIVEWTIQKFVPQQKQIVEYLEAPRDQKAELAKNLTGEELDLAHYMMEKYQEVLDYHAKIEAEFGTRFGDDNYYTHIRRGILENIKEDGIIKSFKEIFQHYKQDQQVFNILDEDTGDILPLEKFFQYSIRRSGELNPTDNVVKSFTTYMQTFYKKAMLDALIPKLDIYAHSLTPTKTTPKGLEMDRSLIKFVKTWINNKKGRREKIVAKQGGKIDMAIRGIKMLTSTLHLGLKVGVGLASHVGETVTNYAVMGKKQMATGLYRKRTEQGKKILKKYENFTGENPWSELVEPGKEIGERLNEGLFILFRNASVSANRTALLGLMTKNEFMAGEISHNRLAEIKRDLGRFRAVEGSKSIVGSSPEGGIFTQYLSWAVPPARTIISNSTALLKSITRTYGKGERISKKQALELLRIMEVGVVVAIVMMLDDDEEEEGIIGDLKKKAKRELSTLFQSVTPDTWIKVPVAMQFLIDLTSNLGAFLKLERYKTDGEGYKEGELKGWKKLKRQFTPGFIKQFQKDDNEYEDIKSEIKEQQSERDILSDEAEKLHNELKKLPRDEANQIVAELKNINTDLYNKLKSIIEAEKLGLTDKDKLIKQLGVENGKRAEYIYKEVEKLKTSEEKNNYLNDLKKKKIISDNVWGQIKEIKKNPPNSDITKEEYLEDRGMLGLMSDYTKAFMTDPANAWKALATKEKLGIVEGNLVELQRFYGIKYTDEGGSQERKKKIMEEIGLSWENRDEYKLEHIVPVTAGGDTSDENLMPVTNELHNLYTPIDIALGIAVKNEEITRKKAEKLARAFKVDKTMTAEDVMKALD